MKKDFSIRKGVKKDIPDALRLIKELAVFEREPDAVITTEESMLKDGFGDKPIFEFYVAEINNEVVGLSLFYYRYSTWKGKVLYLEDLIVTESARGNGIGKTLFETTLHHAKKENCVRMTWQVLDWNTPAIEFYLQYGASMDGQWINGTLDINL
ncbi:MAG: GNAT family N-acetyltransferase [Bacteroidetes bacterium]|nr:GNAT family N-acetyltransferase [Bacteroidota bacterium]